MEHSNDAIARIRSLETLAEVHAASMRDLRERLRESYETWRHGNEQILTGIMKSEEWLKHPQTGLWVRLDRLEKAQEQRTKLQWWFMGLLSSTLILLVGIGLGKLLK